MWFILKRPNNSILLLLLPASLSPLWCLAVLKITRETVVDDSSQNPVSWNLSSLGNLASIDISISLPSSKWFSSTFKKCLKVHWRKFKDAQKPMVRAKCETGLRIGHQELGDKLKWTLILKGVQERFYIEEKFTLVTYAIPGEEQKATLSYALIISREDQPLLLSIFLLGGSSEPKKLLPFHLKRLICLSEHPYLVVCLSPVLYFL